MIDRRRTAVGVTVGAVVVLVGTFLPWLRSGSRSRSSYEIFELVERLGFRPDGLVSWAIRLWPVTPLLLVLSVIVQWMPTMRSPIPTLRTVLPVVAGLYAASVSGAIRLAPEGGLIGLGIGTWVTLAGAVLLLAAAASSRGESRDDLAG